jgi:phage shock protein A
VEKDERIAKIEQDTRELAKLQREIEEMKVSLAAAKKKAEETRARSELYSRLEKVSGVRVSASTSTDSVEELLAIEQKVEALSRKEAELRKQILTSFADESKLPFGIEEPTRQNGNTMFSMKRNFLIESDVLKIIFDLIDVDYPCRFGNVVIGAEGIVVEKEDMPSAVNKAADALEKLRTTARTLSEVLFDENKLKSLCETIHSSEKSYKPIVEEIGNNCPNQVTTRKIAETRNMNVDAVSSISSMLVQGKNWAGKCSILKRTAEGGLTFNSLERAIWSSYQKLYAIPQKVEQHCTEEKQKSLFNFSEE